MLSKYNVITLFPKLFKEWKNTGVISNGLNDSIFTLNTIDLREYGICLLYTSPSPRDRTR